MLSQGPMHVAMVMFVDQPSTPPPKICCCFWLFCVFTKALRTNESRKPCCLGSSSEGERSSHHFMLRSILLQGIQCIMFNEQTASRVARQKACVCTSFLAYLVYFVLPLFWFYYLPLNYALCNACDH